MADLTLPPGDPEALEAAAAALSRYGAKTGDLAAATHRSTTSAVSNADWDGSAADAYTAYTGGLVSGVGSIEHPLSRVPAAVAGYAAALRTAQAKVRAYGIHADQVNRIQGPVSKAEASQIQTQSQQLETDAQHALQGLDEAAADAARVLTSIGETLAGVFDGSGPFHTWLEKVMRPWDATAGDVFLEALLKKGENAEDVFKKAEKAAEEGKETLKDLPSELENKWQNILDDEIEEGIKGNFDGTNAAARMARLQDAVETFSKGLGDAPEESTLLKLLPGLKAFGGVTSAAGLVGGVYTLLEPSEYDHGGQRIAARVAGGASALGGGIGLGVSLNVIADSAAVAGLSVPVVGEVLAVGGGLYLTGDFLYHHTHQIAHGFDVARHAAAHYADDVGSGIASAAKTVGHGIASGAGTVEHGISSGLSDVTGGLL